MSLISRISEGFARLATNKKTKDTKGLDLKKPLTHQLTRQWQSGAKMEVEAWRKAVRLADNPNQPRRIELLKIYKEALWDFELMTATRNALVDIQAAPFAILKNGVEAKKSKELFDKTWFMDFIQFALEVEFWGYSVIDFDVVKDADGQFKKINLFPREHYRPEDEVILKAVHDFDGIPLDKIKELGFKILTLGDKTNLGLLQIASLLVIRKNYTLTDWSIRNEKFGMPFIWLGTDSRDKNELEKREQMLANFGSNSYGIGGKDEDLKFFEAGSNGSEHLTYKEFLDYADRGIDKLINGQTGTSDQKAYVGAAEVHERVMGQYTKSRLMKIQSMVNDVLIPFLITEGYRLKDCKLQYLEIWDDNPQRQKQANQNDPTPPTDPTNGGGQKKNLSSGERFEKLTHIYKVSDCCDTHQPERVNLASIDDIFDKAIKNVFDKKIKAGQLDKDIFKYNLSEIWKGGLDGFTTAYGDDTPDEDLKKALRQNAGSFAALKNHANVQDMVDALTDENGNARTFEEFKAEALKINATYNKVWLETEYNLAQRSASMAVEWQRIQDNADILPNLKYVTVGDDKVRKAHEKLDGLVLPITDEFWNSFYPPNGWGCRCTVEQTDADVQEPNFIPDDTEVPESMRFNVGKERKLFSDDHPYFQVSEAARKRIEKQLKNLDNGNA